jgi:uncharacterized protein YdhG (YjbR/CyaY superfamily)
MPTSNPPSGGFSKEEREAMKARAKELAAEKRSDRKRADGEQAVREAIEAMVGSDRVIAERIHTLVTTTAPELWPRTWYGMPAYARDGKVICFFQSAGKFDARYATFGFNDVAHLDEGNMWPTSFALVRLTEVEERRIVELVSRAVG